MSEITDFGKILRNYRDRENVSQTELAVRLGISRNYVSLIERGVRNNVSWQLGCKMLDLCAGFKRNQCLKCDSFNAMIGTNGKQGVCHDCGYAWRWE